MNEPKPPTIDTDLDYGQALRWVRMVKRCLPEAKIHWVEANQTFCQCGETERLRQATRLSTGKSFVAPMDETDAP